MAIATTTRTHLIYQFIILTLLFLSIGYNELLPDRKFILFLAFIPIFCYQLVIISCCPELIRLPQWLRFLDHSIKKRNSATSDESSCGPCASSTTLVSSGVQTNTKLAFPDISEIPCQRTCRREKSVTNLGATPKYLTQQQKAKSWMSLNDSKSSEKLLSREGSLDVLSPLDERKSSFRVVDKAVKTRNREERAKKARSWKPCDTFDGSLNAFMQSTQPSESNYAEIPQEETELSKSYSFPFRQKKLETWTDRKQTTMGQSNDSLNMPYWQSVGYNLAVKYEARRRRRAMSHATNSGIPEESSCVMQKPQEVVNDSAHKQNHKKSAKSASACINKIKVGFSNLMNKKKDDIYENISPNKAAKGNLIQKLKTKNTCPTKEIENHEASMPEFPQFLNNDRPLIFYPKYLPFEKERFETDVRKKMKELADEVKFNYST